jgi:hypothetical protein
MLKKCWVCKQEKDTSLFGINKSKSTGFSSECRECKRIKDREYVAKHREAAQKRAKEWYYNNYDYAIKRNRETGKLWRENNPDKNCAKSSKKRANKTQATPKWLTEEHFKEINQFYTDAKELEKIFFWKQHVDHIIPLKGKTVCGLHVPWNLQILRAEVNIAKGNKYVF